MTKWNPSTHDEEVGGLLEMAQDAANRHRVPFFVYSDQIVPGGRSTLRLTNIEPRLYLERFDPQ